jgi:hypothetical protein
VFGCFGEIVHLLVARAPAGDLMEVKPHRCYATLAEAIRAGETDRVALADWAEYVAAERTGFQAGLHVVEVASQLT